MSTIKVDTVRPVTTDGSLTLQGDSSGAGVTGLVIDSTGTATTFNASNINGGQLGGFRNLIINGNFQVNQRGQTSGAVAVDATTYYTLDRWKLATGTDTISWSDSGGIRTVTIPSGDILTQVIEGLNIVSGTYVISWVGTATCTVDTVAKSSGDTFTLTAGTNCTVAFTNGTVSKVMVEAGSTATAFEHRLYGVELALCQRYYTSFTGDLSSVSASNVGFASGFTGPFDFYGYGSLPVMMRVPPACSYTGTLSNIYYTHVGVLASVSSIAGFESNGIVFYINLSSSTGTASNAGAYAKIYYSGTGSPTALTFNSEL